MERVNRQSISPVEAIRHAAVAIAEPNIDQRHTGIIFRVDENGPVEFLHLAWHHDLRREKRISRKYCWVDPKIPKARLRQLAAICDDIAYANRKEKIPYSFGPPHNVFDEETNKFLLGPTRTGLTCASFVLAVFDRAQLKLVAYHGWQSPDYEDVKWQLSVVDQLSQFPSVSSEHLEVVRREVGNSVRYRPEQVAAAAALRKQRPVRYKYAKVLGAMIVRFLRGENVAEFRIRYSWWDRILDWFGLV